MMGVENTRGVLHPHHCYFRSLRHGNRLGLEPFSFDKPVGGYAYPPQVSSKIDGQEVVFVLKSLVILHVKASFKPLRSPWWERKLMEPSLSR